MCMRRILKAGDDGGPMGDDISNDRRNTGAIIIGSAILTLAGAVLAGAATIGTAVASSSSARDVAGFFQVGGAVIAGVGVLAFVTRCLRDW